jgi:NAD(P)H-dependent FMN reductase
MSKLKVLVVIGSTREGRFGDKPAHWIHGFLNDDERIEAELVDLKDWPLPFFDSPMSPMRVTDGNYGHDIVNRFGQKMATGDAFVMIAAEYNHGPTAVLKNAIDWLGHEWTKKPISFVGYGNAGGARAIEQLRQIAIELQMAPIKQAVHLPGPLYMAIRGEKGPVSAAHFEPVAAAAKAMRDELVWWGSALRAAKSGVTKA